MVFMIFFLFFFFNDTATTEIYTLSLHDALPIWFRDGNFVETLPAGRYAFWKNVAEVKVVPVDTRALILDVAGQEIMTADKVTLRLNALVTYRVADARLAVTVVDDFRQALYRETQLVLRALVGARELDGFLADTYSNSTHSVCTF